MGRALRQPPAVLRNEKTISAVEDTTSAGRCGFSFTAFFCPAFVCPCGSAAQGIFYCKTGDRKDEAKI